MDAKVLKSWIISIEMALLVSISLLVTTSLASPNIAVDKLEIMDKQNIKEEIAREVNIII